MKTLKKLTYLSLAYLMILCLTWGGTAKAMTPIHIPTWIIDPSLINELLKSSDYVLADSDGVIVIASNDADDFCQKIKTTTLNPSDKYFLNLNKDLVLAKPLAPNGNVKILGNGHTIKRNTSHTGDPLIILAKNCNLYLENVTLDGGDFEMPGILFSGFNQMTLTLGEGTTIKNCGKSGVSIYNKSQSIIMEKGSKITSCSSANGGGIYSSDGANIDIRGGEISDCLADENGGAIYVSGGDINITLDKAFICGNSAGQDGGGIYTLADGDYSLRIRSLNDTSIDANKAQGAGGGIFIDSKGAYLRSDVRLENTSICQNQSVNSYGGGLYAQSKLSVSNLIVKDNIAASSGGGLCLNAPPESMIRIEKSSISDNQATMGAGLALYKDEEGNASFYISETDIVNNTADPSLWSFGPPIDAVGGGGGIYIDSDFGKDAINIQNCRIKNNMGRLGGGIFDASVTDYKASLSDKDYKALKIDQATTFSSNKATMGTFNPPTNYNRLSTNTDIKGLVKKDGKDIVVTSILKQQRLKLYVCSKGLRWK